MKTVVVNKNTADENTILLSNRVISVDRSGLKRTNKNIETYTFKKKLSNVKYPGAVVRQGSAPSAALILAIHRSLSAAEAAASTKSSSDLAPSC